METSTQILGHLTLGLSISSLAHSSLGWAWRIDSTLWGIRHQFLLKCNMLQTFSQHSFWKISCKVKDFDIQVPDLKLPDG